MRKDIFVVATRLLGVMQLVDAIFNLAYLVSHWIGYIKPQSYSHEHDLISFGIHLVLGLYFVVRPYHLFHLLELFTGDDDEEQSNDLEVNKTESEVK
jgi:hypothetical protein